MNVSQKPITTFGAPGGVYLELHADLDRGVYYLLNEEGNELVSDPSEKEVRLYAEAITLAEESA